MKAAVSHLEQFMEKATPPSAESVLAREGRRQTLGRTWSKSFWNNGYACEPWRKVAGEIDQGYQDINRMRLDCRLLVKSAQQMVIPRNDLKDAGIEVPCWWRAALSAKFTQTKIAPKLRESVCYAKDAMTGLPADERIDGSGDA